MACVYRIRKCIQASVTEEIDAALKLIIQGEKSMGLLIEYKLQVGICFFDKGIIEKHKEPFVNVIGIPVFAGTYPGKVNLKVLYRVNCFQVN
jgi:hypothetical protein